jgi:hypothetical protein
MKLKCVYVFLDHRKPGNYVYDNLTFDYEPIYVGKGCLNRPQRHKVRYKKEVNRFYSKLKSIVKETNEFPNYVIIRKDISELIANNLEIEYIKKIGRIENGGTLTNMSDGGEGQSGFVFSEETKKKNVS